MYGLLVKKVIQEVCVYNDCIKCQQRCLRKVLFVLRRGHIQPFKVDESHSIVLRFTSPVEAWRALAIVEEVVHIKGQLIFPI